MWAPSLAHGISRALLRCGRPRISQGRLVRVAHFSIAPSQHIKQQVDPDETSKKKGLQQKVEESRREGHWNPTRNARPRGAPALGSSSDLGSAAPCAPLFMRCTIKKAIVAGGKDSSRAAIERKPYSNAATELPQLRIPNTTEDAPQARPFSQRPTPPPRRGGTGRRRNLPPWASWPPYEPPEPPDPTEAEPPKKQAKAPAPMETKPGRKRGDNMKPEGRWWDVLRQREDPLKSLTRPAPHTLQPQTGSNTLKACIVGSGAAGGVVALHLALCGRLAHLAIVDAEPSIAGGRAFALAEDLQRVPSSCFVEAFESLRQALQGVHVIALACGARVAANADADVALRANAPAVHAVCSAARNICPQAVLCVLTEPVAACTKLAFQWLGGDASAARRALGVTATEAARATRALHARTGESCEVALVGGAGTTRAVPLISRATKAMHQGETRWLTAALMAAEASQSAGVADAQDSRETDAAAEAVAANDAVFLERVLAAKQGAQDTVVSALIRSDAVVGCDFLTLPVRLGRDGVQKALGLGQLKAFEERLLRSVLVEHKTQLAKAQQLMAHMERLARPQQLKREVELSFVQRPDVSFNLAFTPTLHQINERASKVKQSFSPRSEVQDLKDLRKGSPEATTHPASINPSELAALEKAPHN